MASELQVDEMKEEAEEQMSSMVRIPYTLIVFELLVRIPMVVQLRFSEERLREKDSDTCFEESVLLGERLKEKDFALRLLMELLGEELPQSSVE